MPGSDPLHLEILGGISCQLEDLGGEVLQDGRAVDGGGGSHTTRGETPALEVTMDPGKEKNSVSCKDLLYKREPPAFVTLHH